jgi:hypothetical protein
LDLTDTLPQDIFQSITGPVQDIFSQKIFRLYDLAALHQRYSFLQNQTKWERVPLEYFTMKIQASRMNPARLANDLADQAFDFHSQFTCSDLLESTKVVKRIVGRYSDELSSLVRDCVVARPELSDMIFDTAQVRWRSCSIRYLFLAVSNFVTVFMGHSRFLHGPSYSPRLVSSKFTSETACKALGYHQT